MFYSASFFSTFLCFLRPVFLLFLSCCYGRSHVPRFGFGAHAWDPNPLPAAHNSHPFHYPCLQALLAQPCLSIFVTTSKFDVSYSQLKASEPCMNELTIYTKCLIKSAAAPGINIAGRLGMLAAENEGLYSERRTRADPASHKQTVALCESGSHSLDANIHAQFHRMLIQFVQRCTTCLGLKHWNLLTTST